MNTKVVALIILAFVVGQSVAQNPGLYTDELLAACTNGEDKTLCDLIAINSQQVANNLGQEAGYENAHDMIDIWRSNGKVETVQAIMRVVQELANPTKRAIEEVRRAVQKARKEIGRVVKGVGKVGKEIGRTGRRIGKEIGRGVRKIFG